MKNNDNSEQLFNIYFYTTIRYVSKLRNLIGHTNVEYRGKNKQSNMFYLKVVFNNQIFEDNLDEHTSNLL